MAYICLALVKDADSQHFDDDAADAPCSLVNGTATLGSLRLTHSEVHGEVLILSVDDEPTNHMVLEEAVRSQNHKMHQVSFSQAVVIRLPCRDLD